MKTNFSTQPIHAAHSRGAHPPVSNGSRALRRWFTAGTALVLLLFCGMAQAAPLTVVNNADSGAGSLRQAIFDAASGGTIDFDMTSVVSPILLTTGELVVNKNVTILGPGPATLAVDGGGASRVFHISNAATVSISGLTIAHGKATGVFPGGGGGGIFNDHSTLTVNNCTLSSNLADLFGGGIYNDGESPGSATLTVVNSTLSGNSAGAGGGGGIYNDAESSGSATLTVVNSTISGNGTGGPGGGIYNDAESSGSATLEISDSTVSGNSAASGGGISNDGFDGIATLTMSTSIVNGNSALVGGGILNGGEAGSATLTMNNCTLSDNSASGISSSAGGGIYNDGAFSGSATLTIVNSTISSNSAGNSGGGGIFNDAESSGSATLTMVNSTISGNGTGGPGGGIYNDGESSGSATLEISASTISGNSAASGGGISNDGFDGSATVTVSTSTVSGNSALVGGGIINDGGAGSATLTVNNCTLSANFVSFDGGGIYNSGESFGSGTLTVIDSTISDNRTDGPNGNGGGIYNSSFDGSATLTIVNSTLSGNSASSGGGGINNDGFGGITTVEISGSTVSANSARFGGGIYYGGAAGSATLTVNNSTLSANSATTSGGGIYNERATLVIGSTILNAGASGANVTNELGTVTSLGYNLSSDAAEGDASTGPGGLLNAAGDIRNTDPLLGPLQDNGGPTFTHALLCPSPAIDAGKNFTASATDQRGVGFARTFDDPAVANATGGDGTDIGAFEVQTPLICNHPPVAKCKDVTVPAGATCTADASIDNGSFDPEGGMITLSQSPAGPYGLGTTLVTLTVSDGQRQSTCQANVTVVDEIGDCCQLTCPNNIEVCNDLGQCGAVVSFAPTTIGGCGPVTCTPASGSTFPVGATTVTCTISAGPSCPFTVTVNDCDPPTFNNCVNGNTNLGCNPASIPDCDPGVTASDNCGAATVTCVQTDAGTLGCTPHTRILTYTASDARGKTATCVRTFTWTVDNTPPVITCPGDITKPADPGISGAVVNYTVTATDTCSAPTIVCNPPSAALFPIGTTRVCCTATDSCVNAANCCFNVTVTGSSSKCPLTQGYWKKHPRVWPVDSLTLGGQTYSRAELLAILNTPTGTGKKADASLILADQLIAAKLNLANGSNPSPIASTITAADSLLSVYTVKLPYKVGTTTANGKLMIIFANALDQYNNGKLTPGCEP